MKKLIAMSIFALSIATSSVQSFFFGCGWYRSCCPSYNSGHDTCCNTCEETCTTCTEYYY